MGIEEPQENEILVVSSSEGRARRGDFSMVLTRLARFS